MLGISRKRFAEVRVRIHGPKRQRLDRIAAVGIEVHIFFVAVRGEEIIAYPSVRERRERARIEIKRDFIARSKDCELVVARIQQRPDITVSRVRAGRTRIRSGRADLLVNVFHVAGRLILDLQWESVEAQIGARQRQRS